MSGAEIRGITVYYININGEADFPPYKSRADVVTNPNPADRHVGRGALQILGKITECWSPGQPFMTVNLTPTVLEVM